MEYMGLYKLAIQKNEDSFFDKEIYGKVYTKDYNIDDAFEKAFTHYSQKSDNTFTKAEKKKSREWVDKAINHSGGRFNPLNHEIVAIEKHFDITIDRDWAKYEYEVNGKKFDGQLSIKGTVDCILETTNPRCIEVLDYKTGSRINWASNRREEKTYKKLCNDSQLKIYYYALRHLFPDMDILMSIYYINDGGVFSVPFRHDDIQSIEDMIQKRFEIVKNNIKPKPIYPNKSCWQFCYYGRNNYKDTDKTICEHFRNEMNTKGLDIVTKEYMDLDKIDKYGSGGGQEKRD